MRDHEPSGPAEPRPGGLEDALDLRRVLAHNYGIQAFVDQEDVELGTRWNSAIENALIGARVTVVVLGPGTRVSPHHRGEIQNVIYIAGSDATRRVVPWVRPGAPPVTAWPSGLREFQGSDLDVVGFAEKLAETCGWPVVTRADTVGEPAHRAADQGAPFVAPDPPTRDDPRPEPTDPQPPPSPLPGAEQIRGLARREALEVLRRQPQLTQALAARLGLPASTGADSVADAWLGTKEIVALEHLKAARDGLGAEAPAVSDIGALVAARLGWAAAGHPEAASLRVAAGEGGAAIAWSGKALTVGLVNAASLGVVAPVRLSGAGGGGEATAARTLLWEHEADEPFLRVEVMERDATMTALADDVGIVAPPGLVHRGGSDLSEYVKDAVGSHIARLDELAAELATHLAKERSDNAERFPLRMVVIPRSAAAEGEDQRTFLRVKELLDKLLGRDAPPVYLLGPSTPADRARAGGARGLLLPSNGGATLADLYDPDTMPPGLVNALQALDKAVDKLYGPEKAFSRVGWLFERFAQQQAPLIAGTGGEGNLRNKSPSPSLEPLPLDDRIDAALLQLVDQAGWISGDTLIGGASALVRIGGPDAHPDRVFLRAEALVVAGRLRRVLRTPHEGAADEAPGKLAELLSRMERGPACQHA